MIGQISARCRSATSFEAASNLSATSFEPASVMEFGLNAAKARKPLKLAGGCPKLVNRSQPLVGRRSPYCGGHLEDICCVTCFFPIVGTCLSCEDIAEKSCAMVQRWRFTAIFGVLYFQRAACSKSFSPAP